MITRHQRGNGATNGGLPEKPTRRRNFDADIDETDPFAVPPVTRRHEIEGSTTLAALLAAWLLASPFVLPYEAGDDVVVPVLTATAILLLAILRLTSGIRRSWISWLNAVMGAWLMTTAFWLSDSAAATWNHAVVGAAITVLAVLSGGATDAARGE